jgi:DNA-binding CsgD family transcriptional regulator
VPSKVAIEAPETTRETAYDFSQTDQLIAAIFDTQILGIAIFDNQHRFIAVNETLASLHSLPAKDHVGRTLREVVPQASPKAESLINHVFHTGERVLNEITIQSPTRNRPGHWIVNFVPILDAKKRVSHVGSIAFEATQQVVLAECLQSLLKSLPQVRDLISWAYASSHQEALLPLLLVQSAEMLEQCVWTLQKVSGLIQALAPALDPQGVGNHGPSSLPYAESLARSGNGHSGFVEAPGIISVLTPREVEVATLLARSKGNKEISAILKLSVKTVETYRTRILAKLQLHSVGELVLFAVRNKLIPLY